MRGEMPCFGAVAEGGGFTSSGFARLGRFLVLYGSGLSYLLVLGYSLWMGDLAIESLRARFFQRGSPYSGRAHRACQVLAESIMTEYPRDQYTNSSMSVVKVRWSDVGESGVGSEDLISHLKAN